jgi:hypothetical protein
VWFGMGRGVAWREEMMGIIFRLGAMALGIRKTNWERRAKGRSRRRGEVEWENGSWWRGRREVGGFRARETF